MTGFHLQSYLHYSLCKLRYRPHQGASGLPAGRAGKKATIHRRCISEDFPRIGTFDDNDDVLDNGKCNENNNGENNKEKDGRQQGGGKVGGGGEVEDGDATIKFQVTRAGASV